MKIFTLFLLTSGLSYALTTFPRSSTHSLIHRHVKRAEPVEPEARPAEGRPAPLEMDPHEYTNPHDGTLEVPVLAEQFHDAVEEQPKYDTVEYAAKGDANPNGIETTISESEFRVGEDMFTLKVVEFNDDFYASTMDALKLVTDLNHDMNGAEFSPLNPAPPTLLQRIEQRKSFLEYPHLETLERLESQEDVIAREPTPQKPTTVVVNTLEHEAHSMPALDDQVQAEKPSMFSWAYWSGAPKDGGDDLSGPTLPLYNPPRSPYAPHFDTVDPKSQPWFKRGIALLNDFVQGPEDPPPQRRRSLRPHPLKRRQSVITTVEGQEGVVASGTTNATFQLQADFELYLSMFNVAQANVSEAIYPILAEVIDSTNSTLIHEAALSVYSDLTASAPLVLGPFNHGSNCLTWLEDRFINSSGITNMSDPRIVGMFATDQILLEVYEYMWTNASAAANKTGLLSDMVALSQKLSPTNSSNMPSGYASYHAQPFDISYFVNTNTTANAKNGTSH